MRFDLRDRITAANAMDHAWFDDIITCRRPGIMTRQRHSMSLAGPIPSLAAEDDEIEIRYLLSYDRFVDKNSWVRFMLMHIMLLISLELMA